MSYNKNNKTKFSTQFRQTAQNAGLLLMTMAATVGWIEVPTAHHEKKAMLAKQPIYEVAAPKHDVEHPIERFERVQRPSVIQWARTPVDTRKKLPIVT